MGHNEWCMCLHLTTMLCIVDDVRRTPNQITNPDNAFFLKPDHPRHRQYEALRAYFVEDLSSREVARRFGYQPGSFRILVFRFRHEMDRAFFRDVVRGPQTQPKKDAVRERNVALRKENLSVYDIRDKLEQAGHNPLSVTAIQEVLRSEGFARLPRRGDDERPRAPRADPDAVADVRTFSLESRTFTTHAGGLFLLLPILAGFGLDRLVEQSGFPGTKMIPATHAVRTALLMKLLGKSRRSHVMDLVFDEGIALAAGLNAVPKATYMSQYSSRLGRRAIAALLGHWVERLRQAKALEGKSFNLDFHSISYFGDDPFVEKHYVPRRSQRRKAVLAFFAQDADAQLVFYSKLTTYAVLSQLNELGIHFITLRRRSHALVAEVIAQPSSAWRTVELDVPHRKFKTPRIIDQRISLKGYRGIVRQLLIQDLGHDQPTILLTNDLSTTTKNLVTRYARRMLIENGLADSVGFFHLDSLSSAVALNVDFDVLLTVIASGIYRALAQELRGYEHAQGRQVFRRFLDTSARVTVSAKDILVNLPRRAHNPVLIDSGLLDKATTVPWWGGRKLRFEIR